ncbi:MAG: dihydroxyacetone kinase subunit DhaK [Opitutales bacterium]|nr:dihydroxyacetone kinase subunit DhaK [Opitutales bacterium]
MKMKKFINAPENLAQELLEGLVAAYPKKVKLEEGKIVVRATPKPEDKVAVVTLGGAGHEPALSGFVGYGMLDASVVGDIFAAPNAVALLAGLRKFKRDAGILLVVLNHAGDVMSANMAMKMAEREGIKVKSVLVADDISAGVDTPTADRRGLAGCIPLFKVAGAAAEEGKSLDEVLAVAEKFNARIATLAVAMTGCTHPQTGQPITELGDDEMEIGMGQHGEGGGGRSKILTADETAKIMFGDLSKAVSLKAGEKIFLAMNGVGATTPMELAIVFRAVKKLAQESGVEVVGGIIDEMLTVQEMAGFQMIVCVLDEQSEKYLAAKSNAPYWTEIGE